MSVEAPAAAINGAEALGSIATAMPTTALPETGGSFMPMSASDLRGLMSGPKVEVSAGDFNPDKVVPSGVSMALLQNKKIFEVIRPSTIEMPTVEAVVSGNVEKEVAVSLISDETTVTPIYGPRVEETAPLVLEETALKPVDQIIQKVGESVSSVDQRGSEPEAHMVEVDPRQNSSEDQPRFFGQTPNEDVATDVAFVLQEAQRIENSDLDANTKALGLALLKNAVLEKHEAGIKSEEDAKALAQIQALSDVQEVVMPNMSVAPATSVENLVEEITGTEPETQTETEAQKSTVTSTAAEPNDQTPPLSDNTTEDRDEKEKKKPGADEPQWEVKRAINKWKDAEKVLKERLKKAARIFQGLTRRTNPKDYLDAHLVELDVPGIEETARILAGKLRLPLVAAEAGVAIRFVEPKDMEKAVEYVIWKNKPEEDNEEMQPKGIVAESRLPGGARQLAETGATSIAFKEKPKMWLPVKKQALIDPIQANKLQQKAA